MVNRLARPQRKARSGLTLIELIAVIVILAILAASAAPAMNRIGQSRAAAAAQHLAADLNLARRYAVTSGRSVWLQFDVTNDRWSMLMEPLDSPGRANATLINDPATGRPFVIELRDSAFADVVIVSCSFDGEQRIGFDWRGRPHTDDDVPLASVGEINLSRGYRVTVEPGSGLVAHLGP